MANTIGILDTSIGGCFNGVGDVVVFFGVLVQHGIAVVNPIDLGRLKNDFRADFVGAQGGRGIGGEKRIPRPGDKNHHMSQFQMTGGAPQDEWLGHVVHLDGGLHAHLDDLADVAGQPAALLVAAAVVRLHTCR